MCANLMRFVWCAKFTLWNLRIVISLLWLLLLPIICHYTSLYQCLQWFAGIDVVVVIHHLLPLINTHHCTRTCLIRKSSIKAIVKHVDKMNLINSITSWQNSKKFNKINQLAKNIENEQKQKGSHFFTC